MHIALTVHDKEGKQHEDFPVKIYKIKYSDELQTELEQKEEECKDELEAKPKPSPKKAETSTQPGGSNSSTLAPPPNAAVPTNKELEEMFYDFGRDISAEENRQIATYFSKVQGLRIPVPDALFFTMRERARKVNLPIERDSIFIDFLYKTKQLTEESRIPCEEQKEEEEQEEEQASKRRKLTGAKHHKIRPLLLFTPELQKMAAEVLAGRERLRQGGFWKV